MGQTETDNAATGASRPGDALLPPAAVLTAEVERLKGELRQARLRIADLEARADVDPLLDVFNRRGFERELQRSLAYVRRYGTAAALLYVDLDGFKSVNDRHGHAAGDALLRAIVQRLNAHVRASDVVGRLGGDEFVVLLWNVGGEPAVAKARELELVIADATAVHGECRIAVGASIGVAPLDADGSVAAMIDAADRAMYARKKERRSF